MACKRAGLPGKVRQTPDWQMFVRRLIVRCDMPENMIDLWAQRGGRNCRLTKEAAGPPFHVIIERAAAVLVDRTFAVHNEAVRFAIDEMNAADVPNVLDGESP